MLASPGYRFCWEDNPPLARTCLGRRIDDTATRYELTVRGAWTLTPVENGGRPWREDYELIQSQANASDAVAYPVRSRLFGQQVAARK